MLEQSGNPYHQGNISALKPIRTNENQPMKSTKYWRFSAAKSILDNAMKFYFYNFPFWNFLYHFSPLKNLASFVNGRIAS